MGRTEIEKVLKNKEKRTKTERQRKSGVVVFVVFGGAGYIWVGYIFLMVQQIW